MARFLKKREKVKGRSPGALIFVETQKVDTVNMRLIDYDDKNHIERELVDIKKGTPYKQTRSVT